MIEFLPILQGRRSSRTLRMAASATICLMALLAACSRQPATVFHGVPRDFRVKGTYYFQPKAAINNFWTWLDMEQAKADFQQLKQDGFNTIVLLIPWGLFQQSIQPITYNELAFRELDQLISLADSSGLKVILRVGSHEYVPRGAGGSN